MAKDGKEKIMAKDGKEKIMAKDGKEKATEDLVEESGEEKEGDGGNVGSKTVLIIIIAGFVLFMAMAGAGFYILWQKMPGSPANSVTVSKSATEKGQPTKGLGPLYALNPFVVNLAGGGGKRFLRVKMDFELKDQTIFEKVRAQFPRVKDKILTILSAKKFEDINTVKGKSDLRAEIAATIDTLFSKGAVTNVYFTEFVIE
jgi:flagellar FliL protein